MSMTRAKAGSGMAALCLVLAVIFTYLGFTHHQDAAAATAPTPAAAAHVTAVGRQTPRQIQVWISQADDVLAAHGIRMSPQDNADVALIIAYESGNRPDAENRTDINARRGTPSKGLMQVIGPTFARWAVAGHRNIWAPVDNIVAGVRYARGRYGSLGNVPGVWSVHHGGRYRPY